MSVEVVMTGRLGNNLFQYAIGRIIAEHHHFDFTCDPPEHPDLSFMGHKLDIGPLATLDGLHDLFPNAPLRIPGKRAEAPIENFDRDTNHSWNSHTIDLNGILSNHGPRKIRLRGNFQRYEYYEPYQDSIRHWFHFRSSTCPYKLKSRDVVLNVRRGFDFWANDATLSMKYYHEALQRLGHVGTVYVCGTGLDDQVRQSLSEYAPVYYDATPAEHFGFIKSFDRIILSNSTFAWWAAFLSDATEILAPRSSEDCWLGLSNAGGANLNMNELRYQEIEVASRALLALAVADNVVAIEAGDKNAIIVHFKDRASTSISSALDNHEWLQEYVREKRLLRLGEVRSRFKRDHAGFRSFVSQLVSSGLVSKEPRFLDEGTLQ